MLKADKDLWINRTGASSIFIIAFRKNDDTGIVKSRANKERIRTAVGMSTQQKACCISTGGWRREWKAKRKAMT